MEYQKVTVTIGGKQAEELPLMLDADGKVCLRPKAKKHTAKPPDETIDKDE